MFSQPNTCTIAVIGERNTSGGMPMRPSGPRTKNANVWMQALQLCATLGLQCTGHPRTNSLLHDSQTAVYMLRATCGRETSEF